ncbi:MAG: hypothetical protein LBB40_06085 [Holophagales bacterium]|jgi:thiol-disulfide isomerase/thioredoxin|nr:hypothetical protein [Holophagales bacterium]
MKLPLSLTSTILGLCLGLGLTAQTPQQQAPPPEIAELEAALGIADIPARVKELKRIKAAYPESRLNGQIDLFLLDAIGRSADSFDELIIAQREIIASAKGSDRLSLTATAANQLVSLPKSASFPKPDVLKAVQDYKSDFLKLLDNPEATADIPQDRRSAIMDTLKTLLDLPLAKALFMSGDTEGALNTLVEYAKTGTRSAQYYKILGEVYADQALEAFFSAAVEGDPEAKEKANAVYTKVNGKSDGFEAEFDRRQARLPFHPAPFQAPADWKGKAVLAEIFTGSECPPCIGADMAFDGLLETYPSKYLAVLEYHLPIPRYDPMMNAATKKREDFYKIRSTPSAAIDGTLLQPGGGGRAAAEPLYNNYKKEIDPRLLPAPVVTIKANATLSGEIVKVDCEFSRVVKGADYNVVLVQGVEDFKGGNGIKYHKMVVRAIETVKPSSKASVSFNISESEKSADSHITEWGKTAPQGRMDGSKWPVKQNIINRSDLKVVVFVQDTNTKQVHNAFVTDVKTK